MRSIIFTILMSVATGAFAQSSPHNHEADAKAANVASPAQKAFGLMKSLAGDWEGPIKTAWAVASAALGDSMMHVTMRVTSRGNVVVHEFQEAGTPLDSSKYDHPVTMLYLDSDQLNLVHYCDAGNRPHMTGKLSPD